MDRRNILRRNFLFAGFGTAALLPASLRAEQRGTPVDAKAMVAKAIELYKAKGMASFDTMNQGEATGFRQGDI